MLCVSESCLNELYPAHELAERLNQPETGVYFFKQWSQCLLSCHLCFTVVSSTTYREHVSHLPPGAPPQSPAKAFESYQTVNDSEVEQQHNLSFFLQSINSLRCGFLSKFYSQASF